MRWEVRHNTTRRDPRDAPLAPTKKRNMLFCSNAFFCKWTKTKLLNYADSDSEVKSHLDEFRRCQSLYVSWKNAEEEGVRVKEGGDGEGEENVSRVEMK